MTTLKIVQLNKIGMAISDPNRIRALMALRRGELCVCQLVELLQLAPSTVSKHMSVLKQAGLVSRRKDRRWVYYRMADTTKGEFIPVFSAMLVEYLEKEKAIKGDDRKTSKIKNLQRLNAC